MNLLEVQNLGISFGGLRAVDDFNLTIKKGCLYGLIGPNGAGKTTVFNLLTGVYKPNVGIIKLDGKDITGKKNIDINKAGIARTFQNVEVVKEVSVLDNLLIAATRNYSSSLLVQMLHLPKLKREEKIIRARADKILKYMDLYAYRDRLAWGLPYAVLKRIEIARALMCNPQLVILDEPAAGLDPKGREEILDQIKKLREESGITIILVSHSMEDVAEYVDRILVMNHGEIMYDDVPGEVFKHYKELESIGLAAPQVTYIMHRLKAAGLGVDENATTIDEACEEISKVLL